ncbi:MAG: OadG family protein [Clostridiales Family XIII bacterium]|jgi:hypothetical protein|nr:OadG family protein [Clostridiales Family XIII bacterium]
MSQRKKESAGAGKQTVPDPRTLAVITAAVAAYESENAGGGGIMIRKISRAAGPRTAWNLAGLQEVIDSRRV